MAKKREPSDFGVFLRALREAAGLSQAGLSAASGVTANSIARIERGEQEPCWPAICSLADALKVPTDDFRGKKVSRRASKLS